MGLDGQGIVYAQRSLLPSFVGTATTQAIQAAVHTPSQRRAGPSSEPTRRRSVACPSKTCPNVYECRCTYQCACVALHATGPGLCLNQPSELRVNCAD